MAILFIPSSGGGDPSAAITPSSLTLPTTAPLSAPGALTATATADDGNPTGTYTYVTTLVTANGETTAGTASASASPASKTVSLTNIPLGATGTTARNIYRNKDGETTRYLLTTIAGNVTTTYTDDIADAVLNTIGHTTIPPRENTAFVSLTAGLIYYDTVGSTLVDALGRVGNRKDNQSLWLDTDRTFGWAYRPDIDDNSIMLVSPSGGGNVLAAAQLQIVANAGFNGKGTYQPYIVLDTVDIDLVPDTGGAIVVDGRLIVTTMPTTTDPDVKGEQFSCTGAELAGLLAGGAKYVLVSKHA